MTTRFPTRTLRLAVSGVLAGALVAGATIAGAVLAPPPVPELPPVPTADAGADPGPAAAAAAGPAAGAQPASGPVELSGAAIEEVARRVVSAPSADLAPGRFLVGAARASLAPAPEVFGNPSKGHTWKREGCGSAGVGGDNSVDFDHVLPRPGEDPRGWPSATPNCIYLGGFGLGPVRPATAVGHGGVWVRSIAISNGGQLFTYSIADTVGWFARYSDATGCPNCGILDVRNALAGDLDVPVANVVVGSTHTHAGADTYGGWGGIPTWYRRQLRDATIASVKQAVANMTESTLHVGESSLRDRNSQRRGNYFSTADTGATWLQARSVAEGSPVVATWATFAAHPTIVSDNVLHADWPGAAARAFEETYGGVGLMFEGGLGNVSVSAVDAPTRPERAEATGRAVAAQIAADIAVGARRLETSTMKASAPLVEHPVTTNPGLSTLGSVGLFDREFVVGTPGAGPPATYHYSKEGGVNTRECRSAGPTVRTVAGAHRIGELVVGFGPGELFSNLTEVVKEQVDWTAATMVLGQTNDALGYLIQSFEFDASANALTHYGGDGLSAVAPIEGSEYEEVFALDRCLGDHVLDTILTAAAAVR